MKTRDYFHPLLMPLVLVLLVLLIPPAANAAEPGKVSGGVAYETPSWFKDSFLDIQEDAAEAAESGKHVLLFFHLNECPYCERMLRDSFLQEPLQSYIQANFDTIGVNIKGDREIAFDADTAVSEKTLAEKLQIQYTPTIVFLDGNNNAVVRLNGYRSPARFKSILEYVHSKSYANSNLADYLDKNQEKGVYTLQDNPMFQKISDFSAVKGPLAVIFEDSSCDECAHFHSKLLAREDVQAEMKALTVVRLDADDASAEIIDNAGNKTTAKAWAKKLDMLYRPGVVLFDQNKEVQRIDGMLFSFHFKEIMRYVGGGHHQQASMRDYMRVRQEELLAAGVNINLSE